MIIIPAKKSLELYYYTSVETMTYILQGANIYATNLLYMNDSEEYFNGLKELRCIINDKADLGNGEELIPKEKLDRAMRDEVTKYSISFSTAKDLLSQWSTYAGESGVSLKMRFTGQEKYKAKYKEKDKEANKEKDKEADKEKREYVTKLELLPRKVYYCTRSAMKNSEYMKIKEKIWKAIEDANSNTTVGDLNENVNFIWNDMTPYVKRYEFSAEEEYRLVFDWTELLKPFTIDYRNDENVLKPYLDIECENGWPICEIIVGPGFNQDVVFKSILHFLNHRDIQTNKLSNKDYCKKCEEYLKMDGVMPLKIKEIWEERKSKIIRGEENERYSEFVKIRQEILLLQEESEYIEKLNRREFSKDGIILSKSGIPYIF